jgi:PAS domain S-box-containing protein
MRILDSGTLLLNPFQDRYIIKAFFALMAKTRLSPKVHRESGRQVAKTSCPFPLDEKFLTTLSEELLEAVLMVDLRSRVVVYWNAGAQALFGYPAAEILDQPAERLFTSRSSFDRLYESALPELDRNHVWRGEWEFQRGAGSNFTAHVTAALRRTDRRLYLTIVVRETRSRETTNEVRQNVNRQLADRVNQQTGQLISATRELAEKEEQRKEIEQILGFLIRNISNYAVFVVDPNGYIVQWNRGAERLLGYSPGEVLAEHFSRFYLGEAAERQQLTEMLQHTARDGSFSDYYWLARKDGSRLYAQVIILALRDDAHAIKAFLVMFRDDTEQRAMTEQLREKENMAAIGTAAAMLAHQIKNPLNGISTTVQLLERSLAKNRPTKESMMAAVRDLENEIGRLQALLGDFQTISLPQRLNLQPVDLAELAREAAALSADRCKTSIIDTRVECATDLPPVDGDPDRIKQALANLINNSCEAMPNGGTLIIKGYMCGNQVCLDVIDTGVGIPEGLKIFDLFTSTKPGGTGLGLVIVQQVMLAHGGTVTFSSEPGKGTTFRLAFPATR